MSAADHEAAVRRAIPSGTQQYPTPGQIRNALEHLDALVGLLQQAELENERLRREASAVADTRSGGDS